MNTEIQQEDMRIGDILIHAANETEYYQKYFSACEGQKDNYELAEFPFLTRQTVQRERSRFLGGRYQRHPDIEYLLMKRSFGVSGSPMEVYWDSRDDISSQAGLWAYRKERFGITADDKCCVFRTAEYAGNKIMDDMPKRLSRDGKVLSFTMRDLSSDRLQWCLDTIIEFNPAWMCLSPSVALMMAESMEANKQSPSPGLRYIELCGEMLDAKTDKMIREAFHVQTGNIYVTEAAGAVAASCTHGHLHIFSENASVEIIQDGSSVRNEEGDIYITSLQNTAMPLIRLETGDRGELLDISCPCGQTAPVLRLNRGRKCSFITTASGRKVSAGVLRSLAEYTNEEVSRCLAHIQFRQVDCQHMEVVLGVKPAFSGWEKEASRVFLEKIHDPELKQMQWEFTFAKPCEPEETEMDAQPFFEPLEGGE